MNAETVSATEADLEAFLRWAGHRDGEPVELRILKRAGGTIHYAQHSASDLARRARAHESLGNVYFVPNVLHDDFPAGQAAKDEHVTHRRVFVIDVDPVRPVNVSATEAEKAAASSVTDAIASRLASLGAGDALARGMSGSGYWLMLALDRLESTPGLSDLARRLLVALAALHNCSTVKVDTAVYNPARIIPAWGTLKAKGTATAERPHRRTHITIPAKAQPLSLEGVTRLVEAVEREVLVSARPSTPRPSTRAVRPSADSLFTLANATPIRIVADALGLNPRDQGERVIVNCPSGCHERELPGGTGVVLLSEPNVMKCSHATCAGERNGVRTAVDLWAEVRGVSAPDAARAVCALAGVVVPMRPGPKKARAERAPSAVALDLRQTSRGDIAKTSGNVAKVLRGHAKWQGVLAYNVRSDQVVYRRPPPFARWNHSTPLPAQVEDTHGHALSEWLEDEFDGWAPNADLCWSQLVRVAREEHSYDPVAEYLRGLPKWDGECRLDSWLSQYLGVTDSEYTRAVGRKWPISAIARALSPGCQADHALILEGEQGQGKSTALRALGIHRAWVADSCPPPESKDAADYLQGPWIVELAELATMRRAESETLKAYLTRPADRYRPAYGRTTILRDRRCVFAGTTNDSQYLSDPTGARRFWPVRCVGNADTAGLAAAAPMLWAEALAAFEAGEAWHLGELAASVRADAQRVQSSRGIVDPWAETIENLLRARSEASVAECFFALGVEPRAQDPRASKRIEAILRRAGWSNHGGQTRRDGTRVRLWTAPRTDDAEHVVEPVVEVEHVELVQVVEPVVEHVVRVVEPVQVAEQDDDFETVAAMADDLARTRTATGIGLQSPTASDIKAAG